MQVKDIDIAAETERWAEGLASVEIRELTDDELSLVSGGGDSNNP